MFNNQIIAGSSGQGGSFYSYSLDQSLRFNDNDSARLSRTPASDGNRQTFTISFWMKRANIGIDQMRILNSNFSSDGIFDLYFEDTDEIVFRSRTTNTNGAAFDWSRKSVRKFRDVSSWYHIVIAVDVTVSSPTSQLDLFNFYLNGENITSNFTNVVNSERAATSSQVDQRWNSTTTHDIGYNGSSQYFDGYLAEFHNVDGTALDPTSFGETINGVWVPKEYDTADGAYGTNGFYLSFADSSAIGDDLSGNTNDFTATNLTASDVVPDSPTNNWCTFNPLDQNDASGLTYPTTYSEGNLKLAQGTGFINRKATFGMTGGKWYWEIRINDGSPDSYFGVSKSTGDARGALDNDEATIRLTNGDLYTNGATSSYGTAFSNGDVCILAVDMDAGKFWAGRNGTWFASGDPAAGTNEGKSGLASELFPSVSLADAEQCDVNFGQNGTFNGTKTAGGNSDGNGYGDFLYTVPSGFLALNSANLPEVTIGPNSAEQADDYFNTAIWSGNSTSGRDIVTGHATDFVWIKSRSNATNHYLFDSIRGVNNQLLSNATSAEAVVSSNRMTAFNTDGFEVGDFAETNGTGKTFVGWSWKAGGTAVSNTDGSITSQVSAAPDAGFSIATFTMTSGDSTVGHGLGTEPDFLIFKRRDSVSSWVVWARPFGENTKQNLLLNSTAAVSTPGSGNWIQSITDTLVGIGAYGNMESSGDHIMYAFASVEGFSKAGSYVANASADGPFVYTGFRPAFVLLKNTINGAVSWQITDSARSPTNVVNDWIQANLSDSEDVNVTTLLMDYYSNGFKIRNGTYAETNAASGNTFIYLAFAEAPFKYANAR